MTFTDVEPCSSIDLTRDELLAISSEISSNFSPENTSSPASSADSEEDNAGFSCRELQTISQDISNRYAPKIAATQAEVLLLPVDPQHLYAFWETGTASIEPQPLTLRIYWQPLAAGSNPRSHVWFDVPADTPTQRKKIRLPIDDTDYTATLGYLKADRTLQSLAESNRAHIPAKSAKTHAQAPLQSAAPAPGPAHAVHQLQNVLDRRRDPIAESWAIKLHPHQEAAATRSLQELYIELLSILKTYRIDAELIPGGAPATEAEIDTHHASGFGRSLDD